MREQVLRAPVAVTGQVVPAGDRASRSDAAGRQAGGPAQAAAVQ